MSKSTQNRYAVVTMSGAVRKTAATRESAREWKRSQTNPSNFRIFDRQTNSTIS